MASERESEFLPALAGILEVDSITPSDDYRDTPLWGSLTCFAVKVLIEQRFSKVLTYAEIANCPSVQGLMDMVFS